MMIPMGGGDAGDMMEMLSELAKITSMEPEEAKAKIKELKQRMDEKWEHVDMMNEDECKLYNDMVQSKKDAEIAIEKAKSREKLFWAHVEVHRGLEADELEVDKVTSSIKRRKKKP